MKDCKCERRLSDPLDPPSEETMKRAADMLERYLKTMCELNRKSKLPIEVTEEHIKIINRLMEEKKTKKMTKAEAFEYLKGKKVYTAGKSGEIQEVLLKAGFLWDKNSESQKIESTDEPFLYTDNEGSLMYGSNMEFFIRDTNEEISADDILSIEIIEENCELEFNYDKAVELAKPLMHYLNEVRCSDGIRVSQLGIIHEPMSTLIFDNGIGRIE